MRKIVKGKGKQMPKPAVIMTLPVAPELKAEIARAAEEEGLPMNEWVARVCAEALGRPDLGQVPRKGYGRPRKDVANAS